MSNRKLAPHACLILCAFVTCGRAINVTMSGLLDDIFKGYDKRLPPKYYAKNAQSPAGFDQQVEVMVNMYIVSMFSISEANMEYSMSIFLRERWKDERLAYDNVLNLTRLELDSFSMDKVWKPDMFIPTEKKTEFHEVTVPNSLLHIYPDGTIQYSVRVTGSFFCLMHLQKFPFDSQECRFEVESYGYSTEKLKFFWDDNPVTDSKGIQLAQFSIEDKIPYKCDKEYYGIYYPCIGVRFVLARSYGYYLIQIYIPSMLIVFLSWVNFWLDPTSSPARVSLGLLTVLTMTTQSAGARANLPRVSYIKGIDVWMAICLMFVFLALIEFAYVNVQSRVMSRKRTLPVVAKNGHANGNEPAISIDIEPDTNIPCFKKLTGIDRARLVDKLSRAVFPITFLIFNIIYWLFYFLWNPDFNKEEL